MNYDTWKATDDYGDRLAGEEHMAALDAETFREHLWDEFVVACHGFAETEGWSGVIAAVSRAMRQQADEARRLEQASA